MSKDAMRLTALQRIFREVFEDDTLTITPESTPHDVSGWDSVAQVKLVLEVEAAFGIRLVTEEISSFRSVGDILRVIEKHAVA